jgi:AcrR family transcriptional regulator
MRERILKAAIKLFTKKGYENVTMRNIAAEINYSPTTIYHYFGGKDEIFFALRAQGFELLYQRQLKSRKSKDPRQRLRQHARAYVDFALDNPEYYDLMFIMTAPVHRVDERPEWSESVKTLNLLRDDVNAIVQAGLTKERNIQRLVFAFWSLLHGVIALLQKERLARHIRVSNRSLAMQMVDFLFDNVVAAPCNKH